MSLAALAWAVARAEEPDPAAIWARLAAVDHLSATFTQTQERRLLKAPLVSTGTLAFQRPDRLRWEVTTPAPSAFVLRGSEVSAKMPGVPEVLRVDLAAQPQLEGLVAGLTVWLSADVEALRARYEVTVTDARAVVLVPKDPTLRKAVDRLEVGIAPAGDHVASVRLVEPDGDRTSIVLGDVDTATPPPAAAFELR